MQHIMAIDAIIVEDMKTNEYFVQFSVYFQRVIPSEKVEIVSTLYFIVNVVEYFRIEFS